MNGYFYCLFSKKANFLKTTVTLPVDKGGIIFFLGEWRSLGEDVFYLGYEDFYNYTA